MSATQWEYTKIINAFENDKEYTISHKATDAAGNIEAEVKRAFKFDDAAPGAKCTKPPDPATALNPPPYSNQSISSRKLDKLIGTAAEAAGSNQSGLAEIWIAISSGTGSGALWWSNTDGKFSVSQTAVYWSSQVVTGTGWEYTHANLPTTTSFSNGSVCKAFIRVKDKVGNWAGNITNPGDAGELSQQFIYDDVIPTVETGAPNKPFYNNVLTALWGTAWDGGTGANKSA